LEVRVAVGRSRLLAALLLFWCVLASVATFLSALPSFATCCLVALIIWALFRGVSCHALRLDGRSVVALALNPGSGDCSIHLRNGQVFGYRIAEGTVVWPGMMVLRLSAIESVSGMSRALPLMRDAVSSADWRRLSVLLRQLASDASR